MESRELFVDRHIGPGPSEQKKMLQELGFSTLDELIQKTIPKKIRLGKNLKLDQTLSEQEALEKLKTISKKNQVYTNYIGLGYYDNLTPNVILRNVLENPGWYTQYTPYQSEISQGRMEALLNFQTMVGDLTGLPIANASLLDEGTAAAEAMMMFRAARKSESKNKFFLASDCHPHVIEVVKTRALPLQVELVLDDPKNAKLDSSFFGALLSYPNTFGEVRSYENFSKSCKENEIFLAVDTDLLSLTLLKPPGEWGADVVLGNSQRFGVPYGFGGPHAAFFATKDEFKRLLPGRIIGVSKDKFGNLAYRLSLQTREQHIRREKATSNICTAQVLLAVMASMYAVYHGPEGLKKIAKSVHKKASRFSEALKKAGFQIQGETFFDTLFVKLTEEQSKSIKKNCEEQKVNLRWRSENEITLSFDEAKTEHDLETLSKVFSVSLISDGKDKIDESALSRKSKFLTHPHFQNYHSEHEMLRYLKKLENRDLSLTTSMIPLGSCTMKLNATAEMIPVSWKEFSKLHPFSPKNQTKGYDELFQSMSAWLAEITGFDSVSLQPNSGAQGEYAGLLSIRNYHRSKNDHHRNICLIPKSAHGTNPASAAMAGMKVVVVECDLQGNVDLADLRKKAKEHGSNLSALMITYPSTHGVFEELIQEICDVVHAEGGQVYMDGANMNAQVGLCRPADFGADVCHLNLHKTFCIPHGGGGPGMGPIGVKKHLTPFLPRDISTLKESDVVQVDENASAVSSAPFGSASILPISWMYIQMMGEEGLKKATEVAILNANYIAKKLQPHYPVLYRGVEGMVAHECIVDTRPFKQTAGVEVEDIAKRLMDYGFHAPTISFPVPGTMMIEPTESESIAELDRFCDAMISIRKEIEEIEKGSADSKNNVLKNAPHTSEVIASDSWEYPYSREKAVFPMPYLKKDKYWPSVSRVDNVYGDRNLVCSCPSIEEYQ